MAKAGASGVDQWTKAANDSGYAARYASTQTDNLGGDLQRLKSSFETALIQSGTAANGVLREMAKALTDVIHWYSDLSPTVQKSVTVLGGFLGLVGLIGLGLLLMLPRIMAVKTELTSLGVTASGTRTALAGVGAVAGTIAALSLLSVATSSLEKAMKGASPSTNEMTDSLIDFSRTGKASGALAKQYGSDLGGLTNAIDTLSSSAANNKIVKFADDVSTGFGLFSKGELASAKDQLKGFDQALAELVSSGNADTARKSFQQLVDVEKQQGKSAADVKKLLPQYADALAGVATPRTS